ncbi:MAG: hypothetical protein PQJ49_10460 [Sphaerochaetaceae bacterium]|nr:hypothetical protein [Sphaerochaetaceae bacterium]
MEEKLLAWIKEYKDAIETDERFSYERASPSVNLPLFVIQVAMDERLALLEEFEKKIKGE